MASYSLEEIARLVDGELLGGEGKEIKITGVAGIKEAEKGDITFLVSARYEEYLSTTHASAIIVSSKYDTHIPMIKVKEPYLAFLKVLRLFTVDTLKRYERGIHPTAVIDKSAKIGRDVAIGAYAVIDKNVVIGNRTTILPLTCICGGASVGDDCLIYPEVVIREGCKVGNRVIIHSGAVIGSDGFGYARDNNINVKIPQIGIVALEDDVEVGANTTIDRATTGVTLVKRGVKIDNLVQVAHNVVIGEDSILAAQVGVSGSTEIGRNVILAGQAGLVGHIKIGDRAMLGAQGGVTKSIPPDTQVSGYPAREHTLAKKIYAVTARLPELMKEFRELQKKVEDLEKGLKGGSSAEND